MKKYFKNLFFKFKTESRYRTIISHIGYALNGIGISLIVLSRNCVRFINSHLTDEISDNYVTELRKLHKKIKLILKNQKENYKSYSYFYGYPYQSLGILNIFGERPSEERFEQYNIKNLVKKEDKVLDIGCSCGFMSILTSYRTGAHTYGIDINPFMIEIGKECANFLKIDDIVTLEPLKIQQLTKENAPYSFDVIFSFATHWTDDENYRVSIQEHLLKIHSLMKKNGLLIFETHCADVGNQSFYDAIESMQSHFSWEPCQHTDKGTRELYLMYSK